MEHRKDTAIIVSDRGKILNVLYYEELYELSRDLTGFLSKHITETYQCVGLKMTHNIYVPPILLSLQELQSPFIFLPTEEIEVESIIDKLKINWILSFNSNENCIDSHNVGNCILYLEKHKHNQVQVYKDIYYIIRTSGTTGQSKFVKVEKYCIDSNIKSLSRIFNIDKNDLIFFGTCLTFDPSMIELLLALNNRACLLITSPKNRVNPTYLYETLFHPQNGITTLQIVPSLFMRWSQQQIETILLNNKLKILAFGGECFPQTLLSYNRSEKLRMFNLYGITELSCWTSIYEIPKSKTSISLGNALEDTFIEIRNSSGIKIVEGEGEIFIGSKNRICLVDNESKDDKVIFRKTDDLGDINKEGTIFYSGRKDDVYKRFGHKVHLLKIEESVREATSLDNRCIWSKNDSKILLFLIIENFEENLKDKILDKIRVKLLHALPKHYFPDYIDIIRKCPVTSHGKTNKHALEFIYINRSCVSRTQEAVDILKLLICNYVGLSEEQLSEEYQKSTFFEIGGNSILAIQLLNEFKERAGAESPEIITALFEKDISTCLEYARLMQVGRKRVLNSYVDSTPLTKKIKNNIEMKITWTYNLEACVDAVPIVFQFEEKNLVAVGSFSNIFSVLDAHSGTEVAKFVLPDVIEGSACASACHTFLYVGCFDGCLYCLDFINKKIKWVYATNDRIKCKPTLCCELKALVFGSYDKYIHCVDVSAGTMNWKTWTGESVISSPLVKETKIYVITLCGTFLCLREADGQVLWKNRTGSPVFGALNIVADIILIPKVNHSLLCVSLNGETIQEIECSGHLYSTPIVYKNLVLFSCHDRHLYILEVQNKMLKIKLTVNMDDVLSTPCICDNNQIAVAGRSGRLFLVDLDGRLLTSLDLPGKVFSSAVMYQNNIFVGCRDNNLYCVKICNM